MKHTYPTHYIQQRIITLGGLKRADLIAALTKNAISINTHAETLFASDHFTTSKTPYTVTTVELTVHNLGYPKGATLAEFYKKAKQLGLDLCPLELGPHLRLQYLDQPEGHLGKPVRQHQAPYGAITVASKILTQDDNFPKGFYLRKMDGILWLRGYRSDSEHVWAPDDHFVFLKDQHE